MCWESTFFMYWSQFSSHNVGSISDLTSDEYPRICLKELCVFILEIDECAECSRTCEEQCLVQNFPDSAARFPSSPFMLKLLTAQNNMLNSMVSPYAVQCIRLHFAVRAD